MPSPEDRRNLAGRLQSAPVSPSDDQVISPWERFDLANGARQGGGRLGRIQTAFPAQANAATPTPVSKNKKRSHSLFFNSEKVEEEPRMPGKAERILAPGIARAFEPRSGLRTLMTMQSAAQEPGLVGLRQRMNSSMGPGMGMAPDPKLGRHVQFNTASSLERISESIETQPSEGIKRKFSSPAVKAIAEDNIMSLDDVGTPYDHPIDDMGQPILPMHKGGEGIRRLVRTRERDKRLFGLPLDYWHISLLALRGRALPIWPWIIYTLYSIVVVVLLVHFVGDYKKNQHFIGFRDLITIMGLALFLLLSFRTNLSYDRWWEGRKLWDGINSKVENLMRLTLVWVGEKDPTLAVDIIRWSLAIAYLIKDELRSMNEHPELVGILTADELQELDWSVHQPITKCSLRITELLHQSNQGPAKVPNVPILASMDNSMTGLTSDAIACQRILATPLPWAYLVHLRSFIVLWLLGLPLAFLPYQGYWTILLCVVVGYELLGFESIGVEVENPFGTDFNDLPLDSITLEIYAKCRSALIDLGYEMDLTSRVMADPLFAKCYYAASHQSHFKNEPSHGNPLHDPMVSPSEENGLTPSVAIPILEPMLQHRVVAQSGKDKKATETGVKPSSI